MSVVFVGTGALGWTTAHQSIVKRTSHLKDVHHFEFPEIGKSVSRALTRYDMSAFAHKYLRSRFDLRILARRPYLRKEIARIGDVEHIHCLGHLCCDPDVCDQLDITYSVTLDSTQTLNMRMFGAALNERALAYERRILNGSTVLSCTSNWARQSANEDYGVPDAKLSTEPFPIAGEVRSRSCDASWITFIGNDFKRKGGDLLLQWHQDHLANLAPLHIISTDGLKSATRQIRNVEFHGRVPNQAITSDILPSTRVLVLPTWYDQSPIVLSEAAAAGVPVVASAIGGISELVVDGVTGFLCEAGDEHHFVRCIQRLLADDDLNHKMGESAREHYLMSLDAGRSVESLVARVLASL